MSETEPALPVAERKRLIRAVLVFQGKLLLDALRDVVLSPISIIAAISDLIQGKVSRFPAVLRSWKRTDDWINLWSAVEPDRPAEGLDRLLEQLEQDVRERVAKGENIAQVRHWLERQISALRSGNASAPVDPPTDTSPPPPRPPAPPES